MSEGIGPAKGAAKAPIAQGEATEQQRKEAAMVDRIAPGIIQSVKMESKSKFTSNVTVNPDIINKVKTEHRANAIIDHLGVIHMPLPAVEHGNEETKS